MGSVEVVEGSYTLPTPTYTPKDGYTFAGWLLNGYIIQPGNEITLTSPITLEARWKSDYTSVGFTVQPSSPAEKKVAQQILYRTTNFTIDPSIAYDSIIAQVYNEETGEWVDSIYDGDNLIVTAGNGAIDSGFGYDQIVFNAKVPGKYTFRIVAKQSGLVVACSENFTVTWVSNAITAQPKGDMIDIGATLKITVKTNFYIASSEIEYYDKTTGTWKLYESVGGFNWNPFSYNFTNNAETSTKFRVKLYESVGNLTATSNEFTITWTNHKHTYGVSPNGKDETNHWKECTDPACPAKAHSKIEAEAHKDNTADNKCDVCGYDLPIPTYQVIYQPGEASGNNEPYDYEANDTITFLDCEEVGYTRDGFEFDYWSIRILGDNLTEVAQKRPNETYTLTSDIIAVAMWKEIPVANYTVSFNANGGFGSMNPVQFAGEYTLPTCGFTAPTGKQFKGWATSANGSVIEGTTYNVTANVEFFAIWENIPVTNYTIYATAGANGTISPSGEVAVAEGEDKTFTITANSGYHIKDVKVNGASVGTAATYTFTNVTANATIIVEFEVDTVSHVCNPTLVPEDEPDCTTAGKSAYYHCECGKNYEDAQKQHEITNLETWGILNALGHEPSTAWSTDGEYHWKECTRCAGQQLEKAAHSGGTATCTEKAVCATCNTAYGNTIAHSHGSEWKTDANEHWNECACGDKANKAAHTDSNNDGKCDTCEYQMSTTPDNPDDPGTTPPADNPPTDDDGGLGAGAIVGIVIGSVAVVGIGGFALFWFVIKKKSFADLIAIFKK